jgi:YbbR domain-containing protein
MMEALKFLRRNNLQVLAVVIALALWLQVHGQGEGSLSMDVPLQVQGLPAEMVIVNDFPEHVRVTINGLQTRLKELNQQDLTVPIDASNITTSGVYERALLLSSVALPVGLRIEKVQPDRLKIHVDRIVTRSIPVRSHLELPKGWQAKSVKTDPAKVKLSGPEVWLDALREVKTSPIRPVLKAGKFKATTGIETPSGKAIRLLDSEAKIVVRGFLLKDEDAALPPVVGASDHKAGKTK